METSVLETRIKQRATERFEKEFKAFTKAIGSTAIGRQLKVNIPQDEGNIGRKIDFICVNGTTGSTFFNGSFKELTNYGSEFTNIEDIKKKLMEQYVKDETDDILDKLDVLKEYIK